MLTKRRLPSLIVCVLGLELLIYLWASWTSTFGSDNFFAIEPAFIFDKSARNSGRISSAINLVILLMIGFFGLKRIYDDSQKKDVFRLLITLFAVNHLVHFFFVYQNFRHHTMDLEVSENLHGFITFFTILVMPVIVWTVKKPNSAIYILVVLYLLNVSYFIMETFYNKITSEKPAYHNQFGIYITMAACLYVIFRTMRDLQAVSSQKNKVHV